MKLFVAISISLFMFSAGTAEAHFLAVDGSIGVTLHIDPNDAPIAGQASAFYLDIADLAGRFALDQCDCRVTVFEGGRQLFSQTVGGRSSSQADFTFTFPQPDVYRVELKGMPDSAGRFQKFNIGWDIRVDQSIASATKGSGEAGQIIGGSMFAAFLVLAIAFFLKKRNTASTK